MIKIVQQSKFRLISNQIVNNHSRFNELAQLRPRGSTIIDTALSKNSKFFCFNEGGSSFYDKYGALTLFEFSATL